MEAIKTSDTIDNVEAKIQVLIIPHFACKCKCQVLPTCKCKYCRRGRMRSASLADVVLSRVLDRGAKLEGLVAFNENKPAQQ